MLKADFPSLWQILTTTSDIQTASNAVLMQFERPADTGRAVRELRYQFSLKYEVTTMITVNDILNIFRGWLGWSEANGKHRQIIDIYNAHKPLARGYKVQYTDAWCDTTVSAAFITANAVSAIGGTECGVQEHIQIFRKAGIWLGKVKPQAGDLICYDWGRDGCADHIGIVETVNGSTITTIEGNYQDAVSRRVIAYDDYRICGYARPKYSADPDEYTATEKADKFDAALAGTYITKSAANMRNGASSTKYSVMVKIPEGAKVQNYGYYSLNGSAKWLYVQVTIDGKTYTGFVSSGMLKKA
ncbi:MAG: CHAP domain-containing protein [Ruminococcus sp.]|nr:CHAP domain-containing protein [Ruminococcus sp.]